MKGKRPTLQEIGKEVRRLAAIIDAVEKDLPTFGYSKDFARPHIEVDERGMHWVVVERNKELERKTTDNLDELLYWIFETITFEMASTYAARNDPDDGDYDFHKVMYNKQLELLDKLNPLWRKRREEEHGSRTPS